MLRLFYQVNYLFNLFFLLLNLNLEPLFEKPFQITSN